MQLRLFEDTEALKPLREATASTQGSKDGEFVYFKFDPIPASRHQYYYFTLQSFDAASEQAIAFYGGPLESYVNGSAYENGDPLDAQMAFHLNFHRPSMLRDFVQRIVSGIPIAFAALLLLIIPGVTLFVWLQPQIKLDSIEWIALIIGVSLAFYPIVLYLLRYTPIVLSGFIIWIFFTALSVVFIIGLWRQFKAKGGTLEAVVAKPTISPTFIAFWLIFGLSLAVRLQVVSGIEIPFWADSYHHTMISQLIVDNGRVPDNWEPYAPMQSMNYHFGFHTMVAVFHWLTGLTVPKSVLFFAQILNALAVLMAYLLGRRFGGNAWVGVFAALITGLISRYPMYYVNWGRYTQLAGQILLPVLVVLTWTLLQNKTRSWRLAGLNVLLLAGLTLTHYRIVMFYPAFVLPLALLRWYQAGWRRSVIIEDVIRLAGVGFGAFLLVLPRAIELVGSRLWSVQTHVARQGMNSEYIRQVHNVLPNIFDFIPPVIVILGWIGLATAAWQRRMGIVAVGLWWSVLFFAANPHFLKVPGSGVITNFAVYIGAYLIFSILAGFVLGQAAQTLTGDRPALAWLLLPIIIAFVLSGARQQLSVLDISGLLVTQPDLQAVAWIKKYTPEDTRFLVNSRLAYGGRTVVGTDGGWWLPFLTGRQNTAPPMLYTMETPPYPNYTVDVYETYRAMREPDLSDEEFARRMQANDLNHIYIGQQRGSVWRGDETPLDPVWFTASPLFDLVYAADGVRIFQLNSTLLE
ncbi:MAG TPA: hypothetical protein G4N96_14725 [Chloroflexi bacterium]|nr:hypothetical protein [Chloroflexota bacterium]